MKRLDKFTIWFTKSTWLKIEKSNNRIESLLGSTATLCETTKVRDRNKLLDMLKEDHNYKPRY